MGAMWSPLVIELTPLLDGHLGLGAAAKPFSIQQFIAQLAIEAFDEAVLPRAAGRDEGWVQMARFVRRYPLVAPIPSPSMTLDAHPPHHTHRAPALPVTVRWCSPPRFVR
jgi:hypothetical protein